jgi:outer membrane protein assembly factor BamB
MYQHASLVAIAWFALMWSMANGYAQTVSFFRHDGGVASDSQRSLTTDFDRKDQLVWRSELNPGHSTACVTEDSVYLTTYDVDRKELATVALDRVTGKVRWTRTAPTESIEPFHRIGSPAASTPAWDGQRLVVFFGSYGLLCYDRNGELLWSKPMGPFQNEFGASSSPIIVDDKVILNQDHDVDSFLIAVDRLTGKTLWKANREGSTRSYSTPVLCHHQGKLQILVAGALHLSAYHPTDGRRLWWVRGLSRIVDTTPVVDQGFVYLATWTPGGDASDRIEMEPFQQALQTYDQDDDDRIAKEELSQGPVLQRFFRIDLDQNGALDEMEWTKHAKIFEEAQNVAMAVRLGGVKDITDTHVTWIQRKGLPTVPSPLVYDGIVYMVKSSGIVTSLDATSGKLLKRGRISGRGNYYASPVAGDGKIYFASESGDLTVIRAGRQWEAISHYNFDEPIMATPVIHGGQIFVRTDQALYRFGTR